MARGALRHNWGVDHLNIMLFNTAAVRGKMDSRCYSTYVIYGVFGESVGLKIKAINIRCDYFKITGTLLDIELHTTVVPMVYNSPGGVTAADWHIKDDPVRQNFYDVCRQSQVVPDDLETIFFSAQLSKRLAGLDCFFMALVESNANRSGQQCD